jgi:hypothetical protein
LLRALLLRVRVRRGGFLLRMRVLRLLLWLRAVFSVAGILGSARALVGRLQLRLDLRSAHGSVELREFGMTAAGRLSPNIRGAVQISFDVLDLLLDSRRNAEIAGLESAQEAIRQAPFLQSGFDLASRVSDRRYAFERDLLVSIRKAIDPNDISFAGAGLTQQPLPPPSSGSGGGLRLTTRQDAGPVSVALQLKNHRTTPENITLTATPLHHSGGTDVLSGRISFEPATLEVPGNGIGAAKVIVAVTAEFQAGAEYQAEILVEATHRKRIPLIISVLPAAAGSEG